jgi:hypothetical protein
MRIYSAAEFLVEIAASLVLDQINGMNKGSLRRLASWPEMFVALEDVLVLQKRHVIVDLLYPEL